MYHFDKMIVNGEHVVMVQDGVARPYTTRNIPMLPENYIPSQEELEPEKHLELKWNLIATPLTFNLKDEFGFKINTVEGKIFTGRAYLIFPSDRKFVTKNLIVLDRSQMVVKEFEESIHE